MPQVKEPLSNLDLAQAFGLYLLDTDSTRIPLDEMGNPQLDSIRINAQPLFTTEDIIRFDLTSRSFVLNKKADWSEQGFFPYRPFIFAENGQLLAYGYFYLWPSCCYAREPLSLTVYGAHNETLVHTLPLYGDHSDLLIQMLPNQIVKRDLEVHLADPHIVETMENSQVTNFQLRVTNNMGSALYFLDPDKVPGGAFSNICRYRTIESMASVPQEYAARVTEWQEDSLQWTMHWYQLLQAGETMERPIPVATHETAELHGEQEIVFTFDNLVGVAPQSVTDTLDFSIWPGRILHHQTVSFD